MAEALVRRFRAGGYRDGVLRASGSLDDLAWQLEAITWALTQIDPVAGERSFDAWGDIEMINALNLNNGNELAVDRTELDEPLDTYMSILRDEPVSNSSDAPDVARLLDHVVDFWRSASHGAGVPFSEWFPAKVRPLDDQHGGGLWVGIDDSSFEISVGIHPRSDGTFERIQRERAEFTTGSQFSDYTDAVKDISANFGGTYRLAHGRPLAPTEWNESRPHGVNQQACGDEQIKYFLANDEAHYLKTGWNGTVRSRALTLTLDDFNTTLRDAP